MHWLRSLEPTNLPTWATSGSQSYLSLTVKPQLLTLVGGNQKKSTWSQVFLLDTRYRSVLKSVNLQEMGALNALRDAASGNILD